MRYIYSVWCILTFVITFLVLFPVFVLLSLFGNAGRKGIWIVIRGWSFAWFFMIGMMVKVRYHGNKFDKNSHYIVVANHASYIDVPFIFRSVPFFVRPLAKSELAKVPLFGYLYRQFAILVDRNDNKSKAHSVQKLRRALNREGSIFIFPEGTFNETTEPMKTFYDGAFRLALQTNTPILPVIFPDAVDRWHYKGVFHWSPGTITAIFLPPVEADRFKNDMQGLKQTIHDMMSEEKAKWDKK